MVEALDVVLEVSNLIGQNGVVCLQCSDGLDFVGDVNLESSVFSLERCDGGGLAADISLERGVVGFKSLDF